MTTIVTGSPGAGVALAAAAVGMRSADSGARTLLLSLGSAAGLGALLGVPLGNEPGEVAPRLDVLALDASAELARSWDAGKTTLPASVAGLSGDELPLLPGMGALFGLARLRELAPHYEHVIVDAGPHDDLIQLLNLPDSMRWGVRLLIGLDRGAGKSAASLAKALLPTSFLPTDTLDRVQRARVEAERVRDELLAGAQAVFVVRPDAAALAEARLAVPALQLHGLAVGALAAGPLLPAEAGTLAQQSELLVQCHAVWPNLPLFELPMVTGPAGIDRVRAVAHNLNVSPGETMSPLGDTYEREAALVADMPGLPQGALKLTLSGDELIVQVGPYRRHLLLPETLRGITTIRATREGTRLVVRRRGP